MRYTFSNGTFTYTETSSSKGTYKISGNKVKLMFEDQVDLDGSKFKLPDAEGIIEENKLIIGDITLIKKSSEITSLNGEYQNNEEYEAFTYSFSGNTVKAGSLYTTYGTYQIVNNKVKITYTKAEDPDGNDMREFPNGQTDELTILDENTLVGNNGTKYIKK